jgi:MSHA biogenesis protein MshL
MGMLSVSMSTRAILVLFVLLQMTGCASINKWNTPIATDTHSIDAIDKTLDESLVDSPTKKTESLPKSVSNALMPGLSSRSEPRAASEQRFDLSVQNVNARDFFQGLVSGTPYNMVVHPGVKGKISLDLKQVTVPEVMSIVRDLYGYEYRFSNNLYQVLPGGLHTRVFQINYLNVKRTGESDIRVSSGEFSSNNNGQNSSNGYSNNNLSNTGSSNGGSSNSTSAVGTQIKTTSSSDFWKSLTTTLKMIVGNKDGRSVVTTPNSGVVVVRATSDELNAVESYLRSTQLIMDRQVILEAKILEVELNSQFQQGIDWSYLHVNKTLSADGLPSRFFNSALAAQTLTNPVATGGVFTSKLRAGDFNGVIQLLRGQGNVQVLSSPRIATINNQKAVIKVGSDEYFVTNVSIGNNTAAASAVTTSNTNISITPFFSGIALDVTPQISGDGDIVLHVHPSISKVTDQQKLITIDGKDVNLPLAYSKIRETDSIIRAQDGQIVVIGGLIQNTNSDSNTTVPLLGKIPLLGELFKQKRNKTVRSELVILLRPIITDLKNRKEDIRKVRKRFGDMREELTNPSSSSLF